MRTAPEDASNWPAVILPSLGRVLCVIVLLFGSTVLIGWAVDIPTLTRIRPTWPAATPWTALGLSALATSIALQTFESAPATRVARGLGIAVSGLGAFFLLEYLTSASLGLDGWLWGARVARLQEVFPGRPSPQTAVLLIAMGVATLLQRVEAPRRVRTWIVLTVLTWIVASVSILGYLFGTMSPFFNEAGTGMSLVTGLCFWMVAVAAVISSPDRPPVTWVIRRSNLVTILTVGALVIVLPVVFRGSQVLFQALGVPAGGATAGAFAMSIAFVIGMTVLLGSAPEDPWSDETWLGSIAAAKLRLAVRADAAPQSSDDGFLLRRLVAGREPDRSAAAQHVGETAEPVAAQLHPQRILSLREFSTRFRSWAHDGPRPAALDVSIDGLLGVEHAMGRETSRHARRVLLQRMVEASHADVIACVLADNHIVLAQPTGGSWLVQVRRTIDKPIVVDQGLVRVIADLPVERSAWMTEHPDES